jgi:hypothetical protein
LAEDLVSEINIDELFERADRAHTESQRLVTQGVIRAGQALTILRESRVDLEETLAQLQRSVERVARAGRQSKIEQALYDLQRNSVRRVSADKGDVRAAFQSPIAS